MISYIGGKARIGKWIIPFIPNDIETYVEPFGGMFWVFFNMDLQKYPNLKTVVYNDYNRLNSNLFKCSLQYDTLWEEVSKYPCQQMGVVNTDPLFAQMFNLYQKELFDPNFDLGDEPNFIAAAKYVYVLGQVFSGSKPETAAYTDYKGKYRCKVLIFMDKLKHPKYREHLDKITFVENMDFEEVIKKYDSETTYFYLDPPYFKTENYYSNHDFDANDHKRLSDTIKGIQGRFGLSYYIFPLLEEWFPKNDYSWATMNFKKAAAAKKDGTQNEGIELLIMNYTPTIPLSTPKNKKKIYIQTEEDMETNEIKENHEQMIENNIIGTIDKITPVEFETEETGSSRVRSDEDSIDVITEMGYQLLFGKDAHFDKKTTLKSVIVSSINLCLNGKL